MHTSVLVGPSQHGWMDSSGSSAAFLHATVPTPLAVLHIGLCFDRVIFSTRKSPSLKSTQPNHGGHSPYLLFRNGIADQGDKTACLHTNYSSLVPAGIE